MEVGVGLDCPVFELRFNRGVGKIILLVCFGVGLGLECGLFDGLLFGGGSGGGSHVEWSWQATRPGPAGGSIAGDDVLVCICFGLAWMQLGCGSCKKCMFWSWRSQAFSNRANIGEDKEKSGKRRGGCGGVESIQRDENEGRIFDVCTTCATDSLGDRMVA